MKNHSKKVQEISFWTNIRMFTFLHWEIKKKWLIYLVFRPLLANFVTKYENNKRKPCLKNGLHFYKALEYFIYSNICAMFTSLINPENLFARMSFQFVATPWTINYISDIYFFPVDVWLCPSVGCVGRFCRFSSHLYGPAHVPANSTARPCFLINDPYHPVVGGFN